MFDDLNNELLSLSLSPYLCMSFSLSLFLFLTQIHENGPALSLTKSIQCNNDSTIINYLGEKLLSTDQGFEFGSGYSERVGSRCESGKSHSDLQTLLLSLLQIWFKATV